MFQRHLHQQALRQAWYLLGAIACAVLGTAAILILLNLQFGYNGGYPATEVYHGSFSPVGMAVTGIVYSSLSIALVWVATTEG